MCVSRNIEGRRLTIFSVEKQQELNIVNPCL